MERLSIDFKGPLEVKLKTTTCSPQSRSTQDISRLPV